MQEVQVVGSTKAALGLVVAGICLFAGYGGFADVYVDAAADPSVADGTAEKPYVTIQDAVNAASSGETVRIAAGTYDQGGVIVDGSTSTRVLIQNKTLRLIGAGRGKTVILGVHGSAAGGYGYGPGAWRCVQVDNGDGTVVEGVSLRNGATANNYASKYNSVSGGGILVCNGSDAKSVCVVDSDFIGCSAVWGGASRGGTLVRCLMDGSCADNGLAACESRLVNCVVTRCRPTSITEGVANASELYNCTLVDNMASYALTGSSAAYGCVAILSSTKADLSNSTVTDCVLGRSAPKGHVQVLAPAVGDWRLLAGSDAVGAATASRLSDLDLPAGIDPMVDFAGKAIVAASGRIDAGALQGAVAPAAGGLHFRYAEGATVPVIADGRTNANPNATWVFPETYPTQYVFSATAEDFALCRLARLNAAGSANSNLGFAPALDDTVRLLPPPAVGVVATNYFEFATAAKTKWTDPENGDDDTGDGSEAHPYRTLAKAVTAVDCTSGASVIYAKKGVYDEGEMSNDYGRFRVAAACGTYGRIRIVAVDGPEETSIVGEKDPDSTETGTYAGCGANALRGVFITGRNDSSLQGFTIRGCYSADPSYPSRKRGAAVYSGEGLDRAQITDCIIRDNRSRGSLVYGGTVRRCRFLRNAVDDTIFSGAHTEGASLSEADLAGVGVAVACEFAENEITTPGGDAQGFAGGAARIYSCTVVGEPRTGRLVSGKVAYSMNSVFDGGANIYSAAMLTNCVLWNQATTSYNKQTEKLLADPQFTDRAVGDYRVRPASPCVGYGADLAADPYFWGVFDGALDGALVFSAAGRPVVGAWQGSAERVTVRYVDAANGDDGNTGYSPTEAFRTLSAAASKLMSGDVLYVAPGAYDEGTSGSGATAARIGLPEDVTVVATEGPDRTSIVGEAGVRCAYLGLRSRLGGFTLTGGQPVGDGDAGLGGGVCGADGQGRCLTKGILVDNCIISNNVAANGSAAARVNLIGCRVLGNRAMTEAGEVATVYQCSAYGCLVDDNVARFVFEYCQNVVGCSVGANNRRLDDSAAPLEAHYGASPADQARFLNSVLRAPLQTGSGAALIRNCALHQGSYYGSTTTYDEATCAKLPVAEMATEADGSSTLGTFPVDAADVALFDLADAVYSDVSDLAVFSNSLAVVKAYCCGMADLNGNPRVYDAIQDLGCFETDWRARFAKALGRSYLSVPSASAGVRLTDAGLLALGTGDALSVGVTFAPDTRRRVTVRAEARGAGRLEIRVDGEVVATIGEADGLAERQVDLPTGTDAFELAFFGEGSAEIAGCRREGAGMILIFR